MLSITKKKSIFTFLILAVILATSVAYLSYSMLYKGNNLKRISTGGDHRIYASEDLIKDADIIFIGKPVKDLIDQTPTITYENNGRIEDYYTERDIEIQKILKGDYKDKIISVIEAAAIYNAPNAKDSGILIDSGYSEMQKGKRYILFAKKIPDGRYSLMGVNQSKFNIEGNDDKEKQWQDDKDTQFKDLKKDILAKFKDELK